jgi:hypothetical protein
MRRLLIGLLVAVPFLVIIAWGYHTYHPISKNSISQKLQGPFNHEGGYCWVVQLPEFKDWADSPPQEKRSTLIIYENGRALGPPHSIHDTVCNLGQGRFSHWEGKLYFSTSDNSDPNTNGRQYAIRNSASSPYTPGVRTIVYIILALVLAGGVSGLFLTGILSHSPSISKWFFLWAVINGCIILFLYGNVVSPLSWLGRLSYIFLFLGLLIAFSSLFLLQHEIIGKGGASGGKKWAFNLAAMWSLLGILALLFEVFFRIFPVYDTMGLNPGAKFFWADINFPLNNLGYRDRNFDLKKTPHTYRIMVVGDSFTEGAGCRREDTFSRVLEKNLNQNLQSANCRGRVEVDNLGVCGANTVEEVQVILKETPKLKPDLIILAYFPNDPEVHPLDLAVYDPPPWVSAVHKVFLDEIHSYAYYWFFTKFTVFRGQLASMKDFYLGIHNPNYHGWKEASEAMSKLSKFIKENNYDFVGIIFPVFSSQMYATDNFRHIHKQVYQMMRERDLDVIDLLGFYEGVNKDFSVFCFSSCDGHPNVLAHQLLGQFLGKSIGDRESFQHFRESCAPDKQISRQIPILLRRCQAVQGNDYLPGVVCR